MSHLIRKKLSYLKTLQKGSERLAAENFETYIPLQGHNELTDIANNINLIHDLYEAKNKKSLALFKQLPIQKNWEYFHADSHFKIDYFCENSIFRCQLTFPN